MKIELILKIIAVFLSVIVVVTFYMFFAGIISVYIFWTVMIVCAIAAYWIIPRVREASA
jgi:hypothetical protein